MAISYYRAVRDCSTFPVAFEFFLVATHRCGRHSLRSRRPKRLDLGLERLETATGLGRNATLNNSSMIRGLCITKVGHFAESDWIVFEGTTRNGRRRTSEELKASGSEDEREINSRTLP